MTRAHLYVSISLILLGIHSCSAHCSCYTFDGKTARKWSGAQKICKDNNGELVSMETLGEWEFIKSEIQSKTTDDKRNEWWIGLVRRDREWIWLSNHSLTYNKWERGKPKSDTQIIHVRMSKEYPSDTYGSFDNIRSDLTRGTICEYKSKEYCSDKVIWCDPTTTTDSSLTTPTVTSSVPIKPSQNAKRTTADIVSTKGYSQAPTTYSTQSTNHLVQEKQPFPVKIVAGVFGALLGLSICLLIFVCVWKRRGRERKPRRNSHLSKKSRVPVKLEQSQSSINTNDRIDSTVVMNMVEQTNDSSTFVVVNDHASKPEPTYASIDNHNAGLADFGAMSGEAVSLRQHKESDVKLNDPQKTVNQHRYHGNDKPGSIIYENELQVSDDIDYTNEERSIIHEGTLPEENASACVYATVDNSSKTTAKDDRLVYAQLAEFKDEQQSTTTSKKPYPYNPTEYATIMAPIITNRARSKENLTQK